MSDSPGFLKQVSALIKAFFNRISKFIDKIIYKKRLRMIVSFLAAMLICFSLYFNEISLEFFQSDEVTQSLGNIPVQVQIDSEIYEVSGMPDTVSAMATGPSAEVRVMINQNNLVVIADLNGLAEGRNEIELHPSNVPSGVEVTLNPDSALIDIERKIRRSFIVEPELLFGPGQSEATFERPTLSRASVTVVGTRPKIDSIRTVKAIIDASGHSEDFEVEAAVVAYDSNGKQVSGVEIIPAQVEAVVLLKPDEEEPEPARTENEINAAQAA